MLVGSWFQAEPMSELISLKQTYERRNKTWNTLDKLREIMKIAYCTTFSSFFCSFFCGRLWELCALFYRVFAFYMFSSLICTSQRHTTHSKQKQCETYASNEQKLGMQKHCRTKLKIPRLDHKKTTKSL